MTQKSRNVFRNALADLRKRHTQLLRDCVRSMKRTGISPVIPGQDYEAAIELLHTIYADKVATLAQTWLRKKSLYEPLFVMPPVRRRPAAVSAKPLTLVERRASAAKKKVREWQRKVKLANTKIRQYRKRVSYYTKKGVIS